MWVRHGDVLFNAADFCAFELEEYVGWIEKVGGWIEKVGPEWRLYGTLKCGRRVVLVTFGDHPAPAKRFLDGILPLLGCVTEVH